MPKNPFKATRRKSSGNILDYNPESLEPAQSSFRVLERPKDTSDGIRAPTAGRASGRPFTSHLIPLRGKSADDLGIKGDRWVTDQESNANVKKQQLITGRGSGGSGSSAHYDSSTGSARYSSTSTLPSSVDQEPGAEEDLYPVSRPQKSATFHMPQNAPIEDDLPPVPSFASRTGRALSFGFKNRLNSSQSNKSFGLIPPNGQARAENRQSPPHRDRAETTSSYASTAVPPRLDADPSLGSSSLDFGEDFGDMFASRRSTPDINLPPVPPPHTFHRTESEPLYPPRTHSRQAFAHSTALESTRQGAGSPYLDDDLTLEREGFLPSSNLSSPKVPPPSAHLGYFNKAAGYAPLNDAQNSPTLTRMSSDSYASSIDESSKESEPVKPVPQQQKAPQIDADEERYLKRHQLTDGPVPQYSTSPPKTAHQPPQSSSTSTLRTVPFSGFQVNRADTTSPGISDGGSLFTDSTDATPRARKLYPPSNEDDTFLDVSPSGPPSRAIRPDTARSKTDSVTVTGGTPKKMTKAEFEALQHQSAENSEEEQESENEDEDEDDIDRAKQLTSQRRKQEANMSIYRQQMKKTAGGGPTDLPINGRPELNRASNSAPAVGFAGLHLGGLDGKPPGEVIRGKHDSDDDDDVPLGILQAHGFPGVNRPPTSGDAAGRASVAGSIANGGAGQGNLPPFARRLPQDPYFGASIVNHSNREALAFNGDGSVYGVPPSMPPPHMAAQLAPPQMGHPGGLVGVIAGEERARAARRGSPNAQGGYNSTPMPLPSNMPGQMGRTMSMGNIPTPSVYTPSGAAPMMPMMNPMMMGMPGQVAADQTQQQMQQFMQMQMQFMQNMLSMQQGQMGQQPQPQQDFLGVPGQPQSRPMSMASQNLPQQNQVPNSGRSMTMMNPPPSWGSMQPPVRPHSGMPQVAAYTPSVNGFNMNGGGGLGPGYAPSIAPSERSNIGMPSRYRPVSNFGDAQSGRAQSLTSSVTLQALKSELNQSTPNFMHPDPQMLQQQQQPHHQPAASRSTIRIVDKPKGSPRVSTTQVEKAEDEEEGWAAMKKKREERKFRLGRKKEKSDSNEPSLGDLYKTFD